MTLDAGELAQVRNELNTWWGTYLKIVKPRRGDYDSMPTLLDGEQYYSQDTNENFVGDDVDGPHLVSGIMQGTFVARPLPGIVDRIYYATDQDLTYIDDGSVWRLFGTGCIRKSADEPRDTDDILADDSELLFTINASEKCIFEFTIFFTIADANPDIKVAITASAGLTDLRYVPQWMDVAPNSVVHGVVMDTSGVATSWDYGGAVDSVIYIRGSLDNAVADNIISLQWAQRVSHVTPTVIKEGSYVTWKLVG